MIAFWRRLLTLQILEPLNLRITIALRSRLKRSLMTISRIGKPFPHSATQF
jgi:hypothetical protein